MCLGQAASADAKGGDLECSLGNPALETCSSSSGSLELSRPPCTQHFLNTNLHEDGFLGCIICLAPFLSAGLPPRKSAFKTRSTLKRIQLVITSERKKKKKAQQSVHLTQRFPTHFIFVDHWSLAFEDQHLYKSLENVQQMSVPKQPFGCRTPYLWLEFQLHLQKGCPLAPDGGRIQREASSGASSPQGWLPLARRSVVTALVPGRRRHQRLSGPAAASLRRTLEESARCLLTAIPPYGLVG